MDKHLLRYIPKRLLPHVEDVFRDEDGIWVWGDDNFFDPSTGSHIVHVDTIAELRRDISEVKILPTTDPRLRNS